MSILYKDKNGNISSVDGSQTQFTVLPTPSAALAGKIYQYIGNDTLTYINGWFYKCVEGETAGTYVWDEVELYKQATENSLGAVKPDGTTIVIDPDGTIHAMGGGKIKLGNVSGASVTSDKRVVSIRWTDPEDVVQGGIVFAKWAGTKIMKKVGSAPTGLDDEDATLLIDSTTRNAYSSTALTDSNVQYGSTYYYKFFPYSEDEAVTSGSCLAVTPEKVVIENVPTQNGTLTYNGQAQTPTWTGYNSDALTLAVTSQTNVGIYTATFTPKSDYVWWDGTTAAKTASWSIGNIVIAAVPTQSGILSYTGSVQTPTWTGYDTDELTIAGDTSGTAIGTYIVTFTPKTNYEWYDGTTTGKTATWQIEENIITTVPTQQGTLTYDGTEQTAVWNNYNTDELTVIGDTATNAGIYTASFTPKTGYKWSDGTTTAKTASWTIDKAEGSVTLSTNSVALDDGHLVVAVTTTNATGDINVISNDQTIATASYSNGTITITATQKAGSTSIIVNVESSTNYNSATANINVTADFLIPKDWKDGVNQATDAEVAAMVAAADAGTLDLSLYWSVGDTRTVRLSAITVTSENAFLNNMPEQDIQLTIMNEGYMNQPNIHFVVGVKGYLSGAAQINKTDSNSGSWGECLIRSDLNTLIYNAFPSTLKPIFKEFTTITQSGYNTTEIQQVTDKVALFAEKELIGTTGNSGVEESNALLQIEYYKTQNNRDKLTTWWLRSLQYGLRDKWIGVRPGGGINNFYTNYSCYASPFLCI